MRRPKATVFSLDKWYERMTNMELEVSGTQNKAGDSTGVKRGSVLWGKIPVYPETLATSEL
jgi:hypothetical protein